MTRSLGLALLALACAASAGAQDFVAPEPSWPPVSAAALLERGLPAATTGMHAEGFVTRWYGLAALQTRATALATSLGAARLALGVSQTGEPDLGWTALGLAGGAAGKGWGAALRGVVRRDRTTAFDLSPWAQGLGGEVGAGAWVAAGGGLELAASAPALWSRGTAPPLARSLDLGAALVSEDARLWVARQTVPGRPRGARGEHRAGLALDAGPLALWIEARDEPLRGGLGLAARVRLLTVAAMIESHPTLGETVRTGVALASRR